MNTLTLIRGIPGSGKSTLAKLLVDNCARYGAMMHHFEADMWFYRGGKYDFDAAKLRLAHQWCQESTADCLRTGYHVVVSNTFTTIKELKPYFEMSYDILGKPPIVYVAQNEFQNIHSVPDEKLLAMKQRFVYDISSLFVEPNKD